MRNEYLIITLVIQILGKSSKLLHYILPPPLCGAYNLYSTPTKWPLKLLTNYILDQTLNAINQLLDSIWINYHCKLPKPIDVNLGIPFLFPKDLPNCQATNFCLYIPNNVHISLSSLKTLLTTSHIVSPVCRKQLMGWH